ncbi:hypothetical protein ACFSO9_03460 [Mesonia maritima]|uniref:hypothetical protein n=1 Tax=Mesonia maritima TaxID=1793873 RepID=UPI003632CEBD
MLSECDTDPQDGFTSFDLTQASNQIAGGNANITATYYFTQAGAENQTASDQLPSPINNFTNTDQDNQTVYVYIEDTSVNCGVVEPLSLEVIPSPVANAAGPLFVCDDDEDGQAQFDLGALDNTIDGGASNVTVSYHASQAFANAGTPTVPMLYTTASTTVFARVEDNSPAGCYNTIGITLTVLNQPNLPSSIPPLEQCDTEVDGTREFDLTSQEGAILANEATSGDFTVSYYASVQDRSNGNAIADPTLYENTGSPDTIYVLVEGSNGCSSTMNFDVIVNPLPSFNTPQVLATCDDAASDGVAQFDLSDATTQITGNNPNLNVSYYDTQAEADTGAPNDQLPIQYTNTGSPYNETIYVRIRNVNTDCYTTTSLDLEVNEAPSAIEPQPLVYCDDDNDGFWKF